MLNCVVLMGRLTADPELRYTQSNVPVTSFTLAVERPYRSGNERITDFLDIVAWRQTAEFVSKYFTKGQLVAVEGSIQVRSYTDREGNKRRAWEVVANNVHFAESKRDGAPGGAYAAPAAGAAPRAEGAAAPSYSNADAGDFTELADGDDDLPF